MVTRYGIDVRGYFDDERKAQVDPDHFVRINYEAYFFADQVAVDRFLFDPLRYCGMLTDPVSKRRFRPAPGCASAMHDGVEYYFESEANRDMFLSMPESYRLPGYKMGPRETSPATTQGEASDEGGATPGESVGNQGGDGAKTPDSQSPSEGAGG